jgi:NAD(P)-dependent dehydrogenase (short-subunit alcohol dehydrogenase family)
MVCCEQNKCALSLPTTQNQKPKTKPTNKKRIATPEDVAHAVVFLLHPQTAFTTGAALPVDGGLTTVQSHGLVHGGGASTAAKA